MDIQSIINGLLNDQALTAIIATAVLLTVADFVTGVSAAIAAKTFQSVWVADFISTHVVGRVFPITTVAVLGHFEPSLFILAGLASAAYVAETLGSIREALALPKAMEIVRASQTNDFYTSDPTV